MSVNKVILIGNVGKDPEVRYYDNGAAVANFPLATTERGYTAANGTVVPDRTEWHNLVCWRGLAKVVEQYVKKGTQLYVEGKLRSRSYDDQQGIKRYVTEVYVDNLELLGRRPDLATTTVANETAQQAAPTSASASETLSSGADTSDDDDLPF